MYCDCSYNEGLSAQFLRMILHINCDLMKTCSLGVSLLLFSGLIERDHRGFAYITSSQSGVWGP